MATQTATRRKSAANKTVVFLHRYSIKANGSVVYHVRNGQEKEYLVTLNANGTTGCCRAEKELKDEPCQASQYGKVCYHVKAAQAREAQIESEKLAALALKEYQERFPYGAEVATPAGNGVVVGDVMRTVYGALVAMVNVDGELHCVSILDLIVCEEKAEAEREAARLTAELVLFQAGQHAERIEQQEQASEVPPAGSSVTTREDVHTHDVSCGEEDKDPWEGLDPEERYVAWTNYELAMMGSR